MKTSSLFQQDRTDHDRYGAEATGRAVALGVVLALLLPVFAWAQPIVPPLNRGTTASFLTGVATASSDSGLVAGGAVGWEVTPRFELEGDVAWLVRPQGATAFSAVLTGQANLTGRQTVVPFLRGGIGLYHASFDVARATPPGFYGRRIGATAGHPGTQYAFTDPSIVGGGGVTIFLDRHLSLRPEVQAIIVRRDSRSYVVTTVTAQMTYHFEEHRITPDVRPR